MSTTSTIRLEQFDGKKESWPTWKTRAIDFFMANEQAYDLLFSDSLTTTPPQASRNAEENLEKAEAESSSASQASTSGPKRFSAAERYVYSTTVGAVKHADDLKYFDGVRPGDGKAAWIALSNAFEKIDPTSFILLMKDLINNKLEAKDDFQAYLSRFNKLCARIAACRTGQRPLDDDIMVAMLSLGLYGETKYAQPLYTLTVEPMSFSKAVVLLKKVSEHQDLVQDREGKETAFFTSSKPHQRNATAQPKWDSNSKKNGDRQSKCQVCDTKHEPRQCKFECSICKRKGHRPEKCFWKPGESSTKIANYYILLPPSHANKPIWPRLWNNRKTMPTFPLLPESRIGLWILELCHTIPLIVKTLSVSEVTSSVFARVALRSLLQPGSDSWVD